MTLPSTLVGRVGAVLLFLCSCTRPARVPEALYADAQRLLRQGDLKLALRQADTGLKAEQSWRFRLLKAEILLVSGETRAAVQVLEDSTPPQDPEMSARLTMHRGWAKFKLADYPAAELLLNEARERARALGLPVLEGEVDVRRGGMLASQGRAVDAEGSLRSALEIAAAHDDLYLHASASGNLGFLFLNKFRYDEAIYWLEKAQAAFEKLGAADSVAHAQGNLGSCYFRLGDYGKAFGRFKGAENLTRATGNLYGRQIWMGNLGNVLHNRDDFQGASFHYAAALKISREIGAQDWTGWWLNNLATTAIDRGDFDSAEKYNREALGLKRNLPDRSDFYPRVNEARIAAGRRQYQQAEKLFRALLAESSDDPTPLLDAEAGMAALLVEMKKPDQAEAMFRSSIARIESRRAGLTRDEFKLSYLASLIRFYQSYVDFLVTRGETARAFEVAESSRARLLDERLAASATGRPTVSAAALQTAAAKSGVVLLSYWLAPERSFLWVTGNRKIAMHVLPPAREIAGWVEGHRALIESLRDPLESEYPASRKLAAILFEPAREELGPGTRVIVVADHPLNSINLETLPDPFEPSRYLIERLKISIAPSFGVLLGAPLGPRRAPPSILLIGNPTQVAEEYPPLPFAEQEVSGIAKLFAPERKLVIRGAQASPEAYRAAKPAHFSWVHFATHASANGENPLDSALILARDESGYSLTARDAMQTPLHADLVTLSACRGAGARNYSGEGLVGLSWAFLRAGARSVVAGLWDVTDLSTSTLMTDFYGRMLAGAAPADALQEAKLGLMRSKGAYRKPFYWGPFQVYLGALAPARPTGRTYPAQ